MAKIFRDEIKEGKLIKIQDIIVGGATQIEANHNYILILEKLYLTNIQAKPNKTLIFPKSADIAGWIWHEGGYILVSPHRRSSLKNTKEEDITKVKHMRSFIGLYKTLHFATPAMARYIIPLEDSTRITVSPSVCVDTLVFSEI